MSQKARSPFMTPKPLLPGAVQLPVSQLTDDCQSDSSSFRDLYILLSSCPLSMTSLSSCACPWWGLYSYLLVFDGGLVVCTTSVSEVVLYTPPVFPLSLGGGV